MCGALLPVATPIPVWEFIGRPGLGETKEASVLKPSEMIAMGDSNWNLKKKGDRIGVVFIGMYEERQWPLELHHNRATILYCDGHVESKRRLDMIGWLHKDLGDAAESFDPMES
jgi:prepilin-type processing-associated H-X9-DG protein